METSLLNQFSLNLRITDCLPRRHFEVTSDLTSASTPLQAYHCEKRSFVAIPSNLKTVS